MCIIKMKLRIVLCFVVLFCVVLCCVLCCALLFCVVLCVVLLCLCFLCCVVLCCVDCNLCSLGLIVTNPGLEIGADASCLQTP